RPHRECARESETLLLAPRESRRGPLERYVEPHSVERLGDAPPDLVARNPQVLAPKSHVVAHTRKNHLAIGILKHKTRPTSRFGRGQPIEQKLPRRFTVVIAAEHPRERMHER